MHIGYASGELARIMAKHSFQLKLLVECDHGQSTEFASTFVVGHCDHNGEDFVPETHFKKVSTEGYGPFEVNAVCIYGQ